MNCLLKPAASVVMRCVRFRLLSPHHPPSSRRLYKSNSLWNPSTKSTCWHGRHGSSPDPTCRTQVPLSQNGKCWHSWLSHVQLFLQLKHTFLFLGAFTGKRKHITSQTLWFELMKFDGFMWYFFFLVTRRIGCLRRAVAFCGSRVSLRDKHLVKRSAEWLLKAHH